MGVLLVDSPILGSAPPGAWCSSALFLLPPPVGLRGLPIPSSGGGSGSPCSGCTCLLFDLTDDPLMLFSGPQKAYCRRYSLYQERYLCGWLLSSFTFEDSAPMSPLNLITSPIAAHAHGLLKHTCFFFFTGCICIRSGSWGLRAFLIGLVLVGEELGSLPPSVTHLDRGCTFRQVSRVSLRFLDFLLQLWSRLGTLPHPHPHLLMCPLSRASSRSMNLILRPQGLGWAANQEEGFSFQTPLLWPPNPSLQVRRLESRTR